MSYHTETADSATPIPANTDPSVLAQVEEDARALDKAMKGWRKDNDTIMRIVLSTSLIPGRSELLQETSKQSYRYDLVRMLKWTTSGIFKKAMEALMLGPVWLDMKRLRKNTPYTNTPIYQTSAEVILYRTTAQLAAIKEMHQEEYHHSVQDFINFYTKRTRQLLRLYIETDRVDDGSDVRDTKGIEADARTLHDTIPLKGKEAEFSALLARCSHRKLVAIDDEFRSIYALSLEDYITENISGDFQQALKLLFAWAKDPGEYAACVLRKLFPTKHVHRMNDELTMVHTFLWCHWNRRAFEAGKEKLDAEGFNLRPRLEKHLLKGPFRDLVFRIYDGLI